MCGIAGYIGPRQAESLLLVGLERLKYRGYDSAGMAIHDGDELHVRKASGRLRQLEELVGLRPLLGCCGIAHTRWATHGPPTEVNAHPHCAANDSLAVVHNGIIENHESLRRELEQRGAIFNSQTDTEVIAHLLAERLKIDVDPLLALRHTTARLEGSYAFAALAADRPGRILVARHGSPLMIGRGEDEHLIASDVPALLPHAHEICQLEDGWLGEVSATTMTLIDTDGQSIEPDFKPVEMRLDAVSMNGFSSFMAKEIAEQPEVLQRLIDDRWAGTGLRIPDLGTDPALINHVVFLACGTSWHAALLGKRFLEQLARIHVEVDISSEYRYRNPVASGGTLVVAISQSGETADTLASVRLARSKFMPVVSLVNVVDSTMARESDAIMPLLAAAARLPEQVAATLAGCIDPVNEAAELFAPAPATIFLGRGGEYPTALEGALKLKEIAYVHATGYAAGEFKHGPIALVTDLLPVICLCPRDRMFAKMLANVEETRARAGRIVAVGPGDDRSLLDLADIVFPVDHADDELLQPLLSILPLQRYALDVATRRGCDVDQPRNLAKSVTVE